MNTPEEVAAVRNLAGQFPGLRLLVLYGSRARGDAHVRSDWDFAYLGDTALDNLELRHRLVGALHTPDLDLVDLSRAGGLLRYRVAKDGLLMFEAERWLFAEFCCSAASFWFDIERTVREEHRAILDKLG